MHGPGRAGRIRKVVANLLPKEIIGQFVSLGINADVATAFSAAQSFAQAFRLAREHIGAEPLMIESEAEEVIEGDNDA